MGIASSAAPVTSGVHKALSWVHCYSLSILTISHLASSPMQTSLLMTISCTDVSTPQRCQCIPRGLDNLQQWETDLQMKFNPDKCEVIRVTDKRKMVDSDYTIHCQILRRTDKAKYLGITIDNTLSWNKHIDTITKKANNKTAFLRQNLLSCPHGVKATCHKALVRPQLNFASASICRTLTQSLISIGLKLCSVERQDL